MKTNYILVFLAALVAILCVQFVSASVVSFDSVQINGADVNSGSIVAVDAGMSVPITVSFTALQNASDAKIRAWFSVSGKDVTYVSDRFDLIANGSYTKSFSLTLPSNIDLSDDITLYVRVQTSAGDTEQTAQLRVQRESYNVNVLDVEVPQTVQAGSTIPVNVVLKNLGSHELEDLFITAKIDALGISKRVYASDITPQDNWNSDDNNADAVERTIFLQIPSDAKSGIYTVEVDASNADSDSSAMRSIVISGEVASSDVLTTTVSKTVAANEEASYDLVIVNSGSKMQLYTISANAPNGLSVSVDQALVSVPADSTRVVKVSAEAAKAGTYNFAVDVNADGSLVKEVSFATVVSGKSVMSASPTVVLTIVLAVIFVVLVIVLIILLTRKPTKTEELGESYY